MSYSKLVRIDEVKKLLRSFDGKKYHRDEIQLSFVVQVTVTLF